jgi:hypothetical protein
VERYREVAKQLGIINIIRTDKELKDTVNELIKQIWRDRVEKVSF